MKKFISIFFLISLIFINADAQYISISALYKSLSPKSISKHLAFYELYPDTEEGKLALKDAWNLLYSDTNNDTLSLPKIDISAIIQIVNKTPNLPINYINQDDIKVINKLSENLYNRKLPTHNNWNEEDFINADPDKIDLSRALFVAEFGADKDAKEKIAYYEACIDLMALQIIAMIGNDASDIDKINAINEFIYFDMGFRYPPLSTYTNEIDSFTLLPSVIDRRKGICLGTSILYLAIAQRINLTLESITPPGHIFVRYTTPDGKIINIETTARGIDIPSEHYLNIETKSLQVRNNKEVIGLAFINEAALYLKENQFEKAVKLYEKSRPYLPDDFLLKQLLGCCYLFTKQEKKGIALLKEIEHISPPYHVGKDTLASDFLNKKVDIDGIKAIFTPYDDNRDDIIKKKEELEKITKKYPKFRTGQMLLANTWLQLGRTREALSILHKYYKVDKTDPVVSFYLSALSFQRHDYINAWFFCNCTEKLLNKYDYSPKMFIEFKDSLAKTCLK